MQFDIRRLFGLTGIFLLLGGIAFGQETLPPVEVTAPRLSSETIVPEAQPNTSTPSEVTSDTTPVGSYGQPAWTTERPFASTALLRAAGGPGRIRAVVPAQMAPRE